MSDVGWIDIALASVLAVSVLVGLLRGLVLEVLSLAGWVAAYFGAQWFAPELAPHLPVGRMNFGAAFAITFVVVLVVWGLGAKLISMVVKATPLQAPDRLLGAGFGFLRGAVLLLFVATLITLTPLSKAQGWRDSRGAQWLGGALDTLKPVLPREMARHLPALSAGT